MNKYTTNFFYTFIVSLLAGNSIIAMEQPKSYPQLQLQNPADNIATIIFYGMLTNDKYAPVINNPIKYATQSIHTKLNLPSTIKDPVVTFKIVENLDDSSIVNFQKVLPLKHTFNLNDGSILTTVKRNGSQLYPHNELLKNKQFLVKILCAKNPILKDKSFALQRHTAQNEFYNDPSASIWVNERDNIQELVDAKIIKLKSTEWVMTQPNQEYKKLNIFGHGPHGCSNKEVFVKSIIDEKIPANKSYFKSLKNRELTGSFK